ncbi:Xanthine and CO dehydrogenases maturation factor, XdhC/CoxF family [hydrothermal vent metagenome]|uniref:Xanthine and CO dehydrogenases maturation factor, XdhC/CoxF family n=1 Tax=hydrothermal vent metagenome TaxID=652676 RepID=A0A3B0RAM0_9ZZZZ
MHDWIEKACTMIAKDGWAVLVTVTSAKGSVPRAAGTRMLVGPKTVDGTIGGGALEHMAIQQARLMGKAGKEMSKDIDVPLGPKTRQCCGGHVMLHLERLEGKQMQERQADPDERKPLFLFGAGHVGRAIIARMEGLPFRITWVDSREVEFPDKVPDNVTICLTGNSTDIILDAPPNSIFLVMSYSHQIDYALTAAILSRRDYAYCGMIGSRTKRATFQKRFGDEGDLSPEDFARLTCPIGNPAISGKSPEIVAISVIAELLELFG